MTEYIPYLLPLLTNRFPEVAKMTVHSALGEEAVVRRLMERHPGFAEQLPSMVQRAYGIRYLPELPAELVRQESGAKDAPYIKVSTARGRFFLMNHPAAMEAFDTIACSDCQPALVPASALAGLKRAGMEESVEKPFVKEENAFETFLIGMWTTHTPSDWHLEPGQDGYRSRFRADGILSAIEPLSRERGQWLVESALTAAGLPSNGEAVPLDGSFSLSSPEAGRLRIRLSSVPSLYGKSLVLRFLPMETAPPTLEQIGLGVDLARRIRKKYDEGEGLWLLVGPTGSGKSTTLAALLNLSVQHNEKVLSVEDPVERSLPGVQQVSIGYPQGLDFPTALRAFLRQSPRAVMVGEIRDAETAAVALQASRTGHRVLSSIHANEDAGVLRRFVDLQQDVRSVQEVCRLVLHQRLVPRVCPDCRSWQPPSSGWSSLIEETGLPWPAKIPRGAGCPSCREGINGRIALFAEGDLGACRRTRHQLLSEACARLAEGEIPPDACLPLLPASSRSRFGFATRKVSSMFSEKTAFTFALSGSPLDLKRL